MHMIADDPYCLDDGSDALLSVFDATIVARGNRRLNHIAVTQVTPTTWRVAGEPALGDTHSFYAVTHDGNFWRCFCAKAKGRGICSHITAAIMFRQANPGVSSIAEFPESENTDTEETPCYDLAPDRIPAVTDPMFGRPPLPGKFTAIRPHQWDAVEAIIEEFRTKDLVMVDAPVGSGKTLIAELVRRRLLSSQRKTAYVCSSIQLQAQFTADFSYARELKGRSNYPTLLDPDKSCESCTLSAASQGQCRYCYPVQGCPYIMARKSALEANLTVLNTSYFLHAANYAGTFRDRDLIIIDECDVLEREVMGFVEETLPGWLLRKLGVEIPTKDVTKDEAWYAWLGEVNEAIEKRLDDLPEKGGTEKEHDERTMLRTLHGKIVRIRTNIRDGEWVVEGYRDGIVTLRPVHVSAFGGDVLWEHGKKWLLMSGTIVSPETLAESLGWERDFGVVTVPHTFPLENRRVNVVPVASMTAKNKDTAYPQMGNAIANLAEIHAEDRMLVHTVSYELTRYLEDFLRQRLSTGRIFTYSRASERDRVLGKFRRQQGGILLAPSMDRGVDLPFDDCRVVAIAKMPFLGLGDKQVSSRLHSRGGQLWYSMEAVRSLVQMTGRGVRSADDSCTTYILDESFVSNIWKKNKHLLPGWFKEALVWDHPKRPITKGIT